MSDTTLCEPEVDVPLCVDLDGTLIAGDTLWESLLLAVRRGPLLLMRMPGWLFGGKAHFKHQLAEHVLPLAEHLPYRADVLEFLREQKQQGRKLVLATAANRKIAQAVADHLQLFDEIIASDATHNLKAEGKLAALEARFGKRGFDYLGDSRADVPIWNAARKSLICGQQRAAKLAGQITPERVFAATSSWQSLVKALRPNQWLKNVLLWIPLLASHRIRDLRRTENVALAILVFCAVASAVYIGNDLMDIESDRQHVRKRRRPFVAGDLSIATGLSMIAILLIGGFAVSIACLPLRFVGWLAVYLVISNSYSLYLKRKLIIDVVVLAGLYALRVEAGGAAAGVEVSEWLRAFSLFFFVSLAFLKRYIELTVVADQARDSLVGRGYAVEDLPAIESVGLSSGYMAVLVLGIYVNSPKVLRLYPHPSVLFLVCPLLLYWITRIWFFARRKALADDPVVFASTDPESILTVLLIAAVAYVAQADWRLPY